MHSTYKQWVLFIILLASLNCLVACNHKNPLLDKEIIQTMDEEFFLRGDNQPINECADYFTHSEQNSALKTKCELWAKEYYRSLLNRHLIPARTTLNDFKAPDFWKKIKALFVR